MVRLRSLRGKPLARYFPEITTAATALPAGVILDGELIVPSGEECDFAALQPRITTSPRRFGDDSDQLGGRQATTSTTWRDLS